jgi:thiol-disulfide isomerase/thioredoxin
MKFLHAAFLIIILAGCESKKTETITVTGDVKNLQLIMAEYPGVPPRDSIKVFLYEVPFGSEAQPVQLDSAFVSPSKSKFVLDGHVKGQGLYDVMFENGPIVPLVNDKPEISVSLDLANRDNYFQVSGSPASEELRKFIFTYSEKGNQANLAFSRLDSIKLYKGSDSAILAATNAKNSSLTAVNNYLKTSLAETSNPIVAAFILGAASNTLPANEYEAVLGKMMQKYPSDSNFNSLKQQYDTRKAAASTRSGRSWVGKPAPDLVMPDVNGKQVSLSSFRGKYVLVDFWASWCGPCREENPNVVEAYKQFGNKNFTVLGVSLDKDKDNWIKAIRDDGLNWTQISDLAFWNSKAVELFGFEGIPYNVLVDPNGTVIAEGLRGEQLFSTLQNSLGAQ